MFDKTTEVIAHMIGVFHIAVEEERMRDVYAKFKAIKAADPEAEELINIAVTLDVPYTLTDFTPDVDYTPSTTDYFFDVDGYGFFSGGCRINNLLPRCWSRTMRRRIRPPSRSSMADPF